VLCHGRNTDGDSHRFTGDSNPDEMLSKVFRYDMIWSEASC